MYYSDENLYHQASVMLMRFQVNGSLNDRFSTLIYYINKNIHI